MNPKNHSRKIKTTIHCDPTTWELAGRMGISRSEVCEAALKNIIVIRPEVLQLLCHCYKCGASNLYPHDTAMRLIEQPSQEEVSEHFTPEDMARVGPSWLLVTTWCRMCQTAELRRLAAVDKEAWRKFHETYVREPLPCDSGLSFGSMFFNVGKYVSGTMKKASPDRVLCVDGVLKPGAAMFSRRGAGEICWDFIYDDPELLDEYYRKHPEEKELEEKERAAGEW